MSTGTFSREDFEAMQGELSKMLDKQNSITASLNDYYKQLELIGQLKRNLSTIDKNAKDSLKEEEKLKRKIARLQANNVSSSSDEYKLLEKKLKEQEGITGELTHQSNNLSTIIKEEEKHVNLLNTKKALSNSIVKSFKSVGKTLYSQTGYLLQQQKSLKQSELSIGVLSNQSKVFRKNIISAGISTNELGIDVSELSEMQTNYSDQVGRAVILSGENLKAVTEIAKGTMLGSQGAAEMAANMEIFGIGVKESANFVEDVLNSSNKIGLNSNKVVNNLNKGLRMANLYTFKDGVKGLEKMAKNAAKLGYNMDSIGSTADKLFNVEGAIEMASQLQVLGGGFAKLADPFTLMYNARNAPDELAKGLFEAARASARFNHKTGEFEVTANELHRLKEIAQATGISIEELTIAAKQGAKIKNIESKITGNFDKGEIEYLANIAEKMDDGTYRIQIEDKDGKVISKKLNQLHTLTEGQIQDNIKRTREEKQTLAKRAKQAQTFDETFNNIVNQFKTLLLPAFEGLSKGFEEGLGNFSEFMKDGKIFDKLADVSSTVGGILADVTKVIANNPWESLVVAGLFKTAMWFKNGISLGLGFNSVATGDGGITKKLGGLFGKISKSNSFGKNLKAGGKSLGGITGGLLAAGISGYDEYSTNKANGMGTNENIGRTAIRGGGAGLGAWGGATLGASIGTLILPGIGTAVGGLIGGIAGGMGGDYLGDVAGDMSFGKTHQDFVMRPGQDAVSFTSKDTLIGLKDGGPIEKSFSKVGNNTTSGKVEISFKPLKIEFGNITLNSGSTSLDISLENDPIMARNLASIIQEEVRKIISGGRMNVNVY